MGQIGSKTVNFSVGVNWIYSIFGLALALILAFIFVPNPTTWRPALVFGAAVIAGAATLITAINNLDIRAAAAQTSDEAAEDARVAAALEFFYRWVHPHFFHCKRNGRDILQFFKEHPNHDEQWQYVMADPSRYANLIDVINTFEALAIAIDKKAVDEETAKRFFRAIVVQYWQQCDVIVRKRRTEGSNPRLFKEFEDLYQRWKN